MRKFCLLLSMLFFSSFVFAQMDSDEITDIIMKHGLDQSEVMETASWLTDVYGPRLTGSPMLDKATEWVQGQLKGWGMSNVHLHEWGPFGRGWQLDHLEMHAGGYSYWPVMAYPKAWSPSVKGSASVVYLEINNEEDIEKYRGKLTGKFILMDTIRKVEPPFEAMGSRRDVENLFNMATSGKPAPRPRRGSRPGFALNKAIWSMLEEEKPLAVLDRSYKGDLGTVFVSGARTGDGSASDMNRNVVPQLTLSVEHYNRIFRMMNKGIAVQLNVDLQTSYSNPDGMEHNVIAEIPGTDLKDEVVMFGAHLDSWHTGTGATDNAAGSSVMMEAARILLRTIEETGVRPRRTLRLALWTGEEQGLFGSRNYVGDYFAEFGASGWTPQGLKPENEKISAYYNLDNGTGKIRGVYMQGNEGVAPIFREWLEPFENLEARTLTLSNTGGTDHLAFDGVGIPGFQFIQDPVAYSTRTHHSNMDSWDALIEDDLKQAATIIASFVWNTAQRDERLPRKPSMDEVMNEKRAKRKKSANFKIVDLSGDWKYRVEIPGMESTGDMVITKKGDKYDITMKSDMAPDKTEEIKDVSPKENTLNFDYDSDAQGMPIKITMDLDFTERRVEGMMTAGSFGSFPVKGSRK